MQELDPSNPQALQEAMTGGMFEPETTPEQRGRTHPPRDGPGPAGGLVDEVVDQAATGHLPSASALREPVRRRRATGGPAEQTFATLVGLELRPRRMREAAALWAALRAERGIDGRDAVWAHPDLLPTSDDLDDPTAYAARDNELDLSALDELDPADNVAGNVARINGTSRPTGRRTGPPRPPGTGPRRPPGTTREGIRRTTGHGDPARRRARRGGMARTTVRTRRMPRPGVRADASGASARLALQLQFAARLELARLSAHALRVVRRSAAAGSTPTPSSQGPAGHVCGCAQPVPARGETERPAARCRLRKAIDGALVVEIDVRQPFGRGSRVARATRPRPPGRPPRRLRRERNSLPISSAGKSGASPMTTAA